jgi:hypothetical protein
VTKEQAQAEKEFMEASRDLMDEIGLQWDKMPIEVKNLWSTAYGKRYNLINVKPQL